MVPHDACQGGIIIHPFELAQPHQQLCFGLKRMRSVLGTMTFHAEPPLTCADG